MKVVSGVKVEVRSLVDFLGVKFGTEVSPYDDMSYGRDLWNILVGSWTKIMYGYPLGESLSA